MDESIRTIKTDKIFFPYISQHNSPDIIIDKNNNVSSIRLPSGLENLSNYNSSKESQNSKLFMEREMRNKNVGTNTMKEKMVSNAVNSDEMSTIHFEIPKSKYNTDRKILGTKDSLSKINRESTSNTGNFREVLELEWNRLMDTSDDRNNKKEVISRDKRKLVSDKKFPENSSGAGIDSRKLYGNKGGIDYRNLYKKTIFWVEDPSVLFQTFEIIPHVGMTDAERLNAMTRVIIIIAAIMFLFKFPAWWLFLGLGLIIVIIFWYIIKERENIKFSTRQREYLRRPRKSILIPLSNTNIRTNPENLNFENERVEGNKIIRPLNRRNDINNQELKIVSLF